ncbi:hypothetical protein OH828_02040 [Streptomyces anulatus]|uniref:hypothetical protein n=1 Tax=Streptomyces anulatus TaxID=1892 RepID=UPI0038684CF1
MLLRRSTGRGFAVWHTDEFVFGVREGKLILRTLGGADVPAPKVGCVRQMPGSMYHDREVSLLRHLERMGATLLNPLDAQLVCRNKIWQLQELTMAGLPVPDTLSYATARSKSAPRLHVVPPPAARYGKRAYGFYGTVSAAVRR